MELSPIMLAQVQKLEGDKKQLFYTQFSPMQKQVSTGYLCWMLCGVHYFYLGKPGMNIVYWITLGGLGVWSILDLFRMRNLVREVNDLIAHNILMTI